MLVAQMLIADHSRLYLSNFSSFSREKLAPASGFQSMQFRLLENKIGVKKVCTCGCRLILNSHVIGRQVNF